MRAIGSGGPVIGLTLVMWASMQTAGAPAMNGTLEGDLASAIAACPVTAPALADPPEPEQPAGAMRDPLALSWWYVSDDGRLWTEAAPYRQTGGEKVLWLKPVGSALTVTGHPVGAEGPALSASIPDGYAGDYQASGVEFPIAGCWEVTARVANSELRFVTYVVEQGQASPSGRP
jgi:hypothetical protein